MHLRQGHLDFACEQLVGRLAEFARMIIITYMCRVVPLALGLVFDCPMAQVREEFLIIAVALPIAE